jgi:type II secretion system protein C
VLLTSSTPPLLWNLGCFLSCLRNERALTLFYALWYKIFNNAWGAMIGGKNLASPWIAWIESEFMRIRRINSLSRARFFFLFLFLFELLFLIFTAFSLPGLISSPAQESPLPQLSLAGVIVSENASSSLAVLKNENTGSTVILRVGENILGLTLVEVFENRVILRKGNQTFQIFLGRGSLVKAQEMPPQNPAEVILPPREDDSKREESEMSVTKKEFIRAEVLRRLETEWPVIVNETRFLPNLVEGRVSGFKITNLPEKTILSDMGIQKNDIIKEVNGIELNDMQAVFSLYNQFKDESRFEVSLERNGKLIRFLYILK